MCVLYKHMSTQADEPVPMHTDRRRGGHLVNLMIQRKPVIPSNPPVSVSHKVITKKVIIRINSSPKQPCVLTRHRAFLGDRAWASLVILLSLNLLLRIRKRTCFGLGRSELHCGRGQVAAFPTSAPGLPVMSSVKDCSLH